MDVHVTIQVEDRTVPGRVLARLSDLRVDRYLGETDEQFKARIIAATHYPHGYHHVPADGPVVTPGTGNVPQTIPYTPPTAAARREALEARYPRESWMRDAEHERHLERMAEQEGS